MLERLRTIVSRDFLADTTALVVFFTIAGIINERFVAGMAWDEVARSRAIGAPLMVLTARPYGIWRDWVMARAKTSGRISRFAHDVVALLLFQVPIYVAIIYAGGATGDALWRGALGAAVYMLVLGRPYGLWLDVVRRWFGLKGPGQKPMSLGG
ncbi:L-alanine exporter AlaE [Oceaniradius stylonematis]|uniref:L-alanine exporter AlaE n=1 Tax=Oceaniradius stylonematis TaxID=2184161 RepID=UPI0035CF57B4